MSEEKHRLTNAIHDAFLAKKLKESPEWKLVIEACQRAGEIAANQLVYGSLSDPVEIARLQERVKIYKNFLPGVLNLLEFNGDEAVEEANELGLSLEDLF
jgi:hypothetical protein